MIVTINPLEVASKLAHQAVIDETSNALSDFIFTSEDDLYEEDIDGTFIYKLEIQDIFNRWYEYYFDTLIDNQL